MEFLECWEINVHMHTVCARPSLSHMEGLGTRLTAYISALAWLNNLETRLMGLKPLVIILASCKTVTHISQPSGLFQSWWACFEAVWPALHPPHGFKTVEVLVGPQRIQVYLLQVILCRQVILVVICRALATGF